MIVPFIKRPASSSRKKPIKIDDYVLETPTSSSRKKPLQFIKVDDYVLETPSLFTINAIFKLYKPELKKSLEDLPTPENFRNYGKQLGVKLWKSRKEIRYKQAYLESPESLEQYYEAFPGFLTGFLLEIINYLYNEKLKIINKKRSSYFNHASISTVYQL
jgi:hypothetical protein